MTTTMAGQAIPFRAKIRSGLAIWKAYRKGDFGSPDWAIRYHESLLATFEEYVGKPIDGARMLEIGSGQLARQVVLMHSLGAQVTGIDVEVPTYRMTPAVVMHVLRENGVQRAVKSLLRHAIFDRASMRALEKAAGRRLRFEDIDTRVMDATKMEFDSECMDFVFSHSVFEHIADVRAAAREVNRVLRPGAITVIATHLFPSLSGGHNLEWLRPDTNPSQTVPPWDHIRDRRYPVDTYMNELRISDYRSIFRAELDVIREESSTEGLRLLTPDLETELLGRGFQRQDLLTRVLTIYARKRV